MNTSSLAAARRPAETDAALAGQTVIAFGETLVDQFLDRNVLDGAPFNVACHLGALGAHPVLVTRAGKDAWGDQLQQTLSARRLDARGVQRDPARPTGRVKVTETESGPAFEILPDQAYDHIHASLARMVGLSSHPQIVYFGTLSQRGESRRALRELLGTVDARVFLDANLHDPWVDAQTVRWSLQQADVVKLNENELARIGRLFALDGETPQDCARVLLSSFDLERVVVTCGGAGVWTLDRAGRIESVNGTALPQTVDCVGAGDGFAAVFMLGMLHGWSLAEQLSRADAFARALCQVRGAVPDTQRFYLPFIRAWQIEVDAASS